MMQPLACPCLDPDLVRRFALGEVSESEADELETHILTCQACAEKLNALQSSDPFMNELRAVSVAPPMQDRAMDELIERLVRTPPDTAIPSFQSPDESLAAARPRRLQAAEARRQALVAKARKAFQLKHEAQRTGADSEDEGEGADLPTSGSGPPDNMLALDRALTRLEGVDGDAARLVLLRYFARVPLDEAAESLGISPPSAHRLWAFAKAWLHRELQGGAGPI
jgi:ECF sigma factor